MEATFDITPAEIAALNSARTTLKAIAQRSGAAYTPSSAWVGATADNAEHLVFMVLNIARSYAGAAISDDDMFNRQPKSVSA